MNLQGSAIREQLPELTTLTDGEKNALIVELWEENQRLRAAMKGLQTKAAELEHSLLALEAKFKEPPKTPKNSSLPPSRGHNGNRPGTPQGMRRQRSVGRAGGGRELEANPDHEVTAVAKVCPHCGGGVAACDQKLHAVYDQVEIPPSTPVVTRVTQPSVMNAWRGCCGMCSV